MAGASGISSQLMIGQESVYGTGVTPSRGLEITGETLDLKLTTVNASGLAAGRTFQRSQDEYVVGYDGSGDITFNAPSKGLGIWLLNLFGTVVSAQQAATTAWKHTFTSAPDLVGKSLTIQQGVPESSGGGIDPYTFTGCKVTSMQFTMGQSGLLTVKPTIDAQNATTATALATFSEPAAPNYFSFANSRNVLTVNGSAYASIKSFDVTMNNQMDVGRHYMASAGLKAEPVRNAFATAAGTLTADYTDTVLTSAYLSHAEVALVVSFSAALIASTYYETIAFTLPGIRLTGQLPQVAGPQIVPLSIGFNAFVPVAGGQPIQVDYTTTDTSP